jgi:type IV secretion system protein VirB5
MLHALEIKMKSFVLKNKIQYLLLFLIAVSFSSARADVYDVSDAQTHSYLEGIKKEVGVVETLQNMVYEVITTDNGFSKVQNGIKTSPDNWSVLYKSAINSSGYTGDFKPEEIKQEEHLDESKLVLEGQSRYYNTLFANKSIFLDSYKKSSERLANLKDLMQKLDDASNLNIKAVAEMQGRINLELGFIQMEQSRLMMALNLQKTELDLAAAQRKSQFKSKLIGVKTSR